MAELELLISLRDQASAQLQQLNSTIKASADDWKSNFGAIEGSLKSAAVTLGAFGGAIMGALGLAYKASEENEIALRKLSNTLKNVGVEYNSVKDQINATTDAMYESAGISDNEQYDALNKLILITGSYQKSISLLPMVFNLAAAANMDANQAAVLMGRVLEGDVNILHRYLGAMDGATTATQALDWMSKNLANSAASSVSPFDKLRAAWEKLLEAFGKTFNTNADSILGLIVKALNSLSDWVEDNPELVNFITKALGAIGIAATALGLAAGGAWALGAALAALSGPVGWVILAIMAIIGIAILLIANWDWVREHWAMIWDAMAVVLGPFSTVFGNIIDFLIRAAQSIVDHWDSTRGLWENIWNSMKIIALLISNDIIGTVEDMVNSIVGMINWCITQLNNAGGSLIAGWDLTKGFWSNIWNEIKIIALMGANTVIGIVEGMINAVFNGVNSILEKINALGELFGQKWDLKIDFSLPRLTEDMLDIYKNETINLIPKLDELSIPRITEEMLDIFNRQSNIPAYESPPWDEPMPVTIVDQFGNYGKLGETTVIEVGGVNITIEGAGQDAQTIAETIRQEILKLQRRNANSSGIAE
jgi:ElaB/YqjD/DUF883 family membrane-anchored ribosome-binding protein